MRLTRRDVIAALAASGVAIIGKTAIESLDKDTNKEWQDTPITKSKVDGIVAAAEVLYPSSVENIEKFVTQYIKGRIDDNPRHVKEISDTFTYLNRYCKSWYNKNFPNLNPQKREKAFQKMNADSVTPDPEGSDVQRVRYYVINELLFALYTTPTGGKLIGLENPPGHPGGLTSYQIEKQK